MWQDIELGAQFYFDENDYITDNNKVKIEPTQNTLSSSLTSNPPSRGRKRPRRTAKETVRSYVVPDSDEDLATSDQDENEPCEETNLQLWIKHLSILLKTETRKAGAQYICFATFSWLSRNSILCWRKIWRSLLKTKCGFRRCVWRLHIRFNTDVALVEWFHKVTQYEPPDFTQSRSRETPIQSWRYGWLFRWSRWWLRL